MREALKIAVIGSGIGAEHLKGFSELHELFEVKLVCDPDYERARRVAEKYGVAEVVGSFAEACRRSDIDVIDICTPPNLHLEQIQLALQAGKQVICEKPLVSNLAELDSIADLERQSGLRIMPIFQYRFGHGLQRLKRLVEQNLTGEAFVFNVDVAWWRDSSYYRNPWRGKRATELGGALLSQAIHAVDMVLYILGPAKRVFARTKTRVNPIEVEDCVAVSMEMEDGSLGTLSVTLGSMAEISRHRFTFRKVTAESNTEPYANSGEPWVFTFQSGDNPEGIQEALESYRPLPERMRGSFSGFTKRFGQEALCRLPWRTLVPR